MTAIRDAAFPKRYFPERVIFKQWVADVGPTYDTS